MACSDCFRKFFYERNPTVAGKLSVTMYSFKKIDFLVNIVGLKVLLLVHRLTDVF